MVAGDLARLHFFLDHTLWHEVCLLCECPVFINGESPIRMAEYQVIRLLCHTGDRSGGHYWSLLKLPTAGWLEKNDDHVFTDTFVIFLTCVEDPRPSQQLEQLLLMLKA